MHKFSEELLQYIWRYKLLKPLPIISVSGKQIEIIKPGELNVDSGPDFFNALIKVDGVQLAGNVELHIYSSDWLKHNHQNDTNYDRIILHAVWENDVPLAQNTDNNVEVIELKSLVAAETLLVYETLAAAKDTLPCSAQLHRVDDKDFTDWISIMEAERREKKTQRVEDMFIQCNRDYTQTFYALLLTNFGFKVNSFPFFLLAQRLPFTLLLKHSDNVNQIEALLLGMAGMFEKHCEEPYLRNLQNEFAYLKVKYQLQPLESTLFKFSKMRPANFPDLRLAQFAQLIFQKKNIFCFSRGS